jgi:hypothetical protein
MDAMSDRPKGKHVIVDPDSPMALGICDKTGFVFRRIDLVRQMEWRGNALVWTGFMVGKPYADQPNQQLRPPILPPDPVPVQWPRTQQPSSVYWANQSVPWSQLTVVNWVSWGGTEDGTLAAPENQRLSALQAETQPPVNFQSAGVPQYQQPTQAQILQSLQGYNWNTYGNIN